MSGEESQWHTHLSLLAKLRQEPKDQRAWATFVRRYEPLITQWCREHGLQPGDADDLTQNILLKLVRHMGSFVYDPTQSFRAWLRVVARNAWLDYVKSQKRVVVGSGDSSVQKLLHRAEAPDDLAGRLEKSFDWELLQQAHALVRQRVESHTWEAFRLTALEGKTGAAVAAQLNLRIATVFKAKSKVVELLREEISRLESEADSWLSSVQTPKSSSNG